MPYFIWKLQLNATDSVTYKEQKVIFHGSGLGMNATVFVFSDSKVLACISFLHLTL